MSPPDLPVVHLVRVGPAADDAAFAAAAAAAARHVLADLGLDADAAPAEPSLTLLADLPGRASARAQYAAWRSALVEPLAAGGWRVADAADLDRGSGTPLAVPADGREEGSDPDARTHEVRSGLAGASRLLTLARVSLHARSGLEGVLHALAVGGASAAGLAALQAGVQPYVDREICGGCGMCVTLCGNEGVRHNGHVAVVRPETCLACGDCLAECYLEALRFPEGGSAELLDRLAGAAAALMSAVTGPSLHVAVLAPEPDRRLTLDGSHVPQPRVGVVAGSDPVAVDAACADLAEASLGAPLGVLCGLPCDPRRLLAAAAARGAGSAEHRLVEHS